MTLAEKRNIVLIDNLVLDIKDFLKFHPGGRFVLEKNIGRDISKFFYGGYSLVNSKKQKPHKHSQKALKLAKSMVIGFIEGEKDIGEPIATTVFHRNHVNKHDFSFLFKTLDGLAVENFKKFYDDIGMIGKHYLVSSSRIPDKPRHYTICNTFIPEFYEAIMKAVNDVIEERPP